jgi:hypothetical protein
MRLGILSLILERHPLPPPLLLLLPPLSLPPPGCQPPLAILRRPDMVFFVNCFAASQVCSTIPLDSISASLPRLRQLPCIYQALRRDTQLNETYGFPNSLIICNSLVGDISNRQCQLQGAALPCCGFLLANHPLSLSSQPHSSSSTSVTLHSAPHASTCRRA